MISTTVVNALLPVVLTLLLGYVAGWHHDADTSVAAVLNRIVLTYALPLALFTGTVANSRAQLLGDLPLAVALLVGLVVADGAAVMPQAGTSGNFAYARQHASRPIRNR